MNSSNQKNNSNHLVPKSGKLMQVIKHLISLVCTQLIFSAISPTEYDMNNRLLFKGGASDTTDYVHPYPFPGRNCQK